MILFCVQMMGNYTTDMMLAEVKKDGTDALTDNVANDLPVEELCTGPDHVCLYLSTLPSKFSCCTQ